MAEILVFCEKDQVAYELLSAATSFKSNLNAVVAAVVTGAGAAERTNDYFAYGADKVYLTQSESGTESTLEAIGRVMAVSGANVLLIGSTRNGKEIAPRLAQRISAGCVTDVTGIGAKDGNLLLQRYTLGGNTIASEFIQTPKKVISVMPKTFKPAEKQSRRGEVVNVPPATAATKVKVLESREKPGGSVNLEDADTLVCVGRGLKQKEDLTMIMALAKAMNAEVGCSRPISSDLHWLTEDREVGLSGKKCKPNLCIEIGISGQIQHMVGVRGSRILVAINSDKNAPVFQWTDYGIVGDLYQVVPKLTAKLQAKS